MKTKIQFSILAVSGLMCLIMSLFLQPIPLASCNSCTSWDKTQTGISFSSTGYDMHLDAVFFTSSNACIELYREADHFNSIQFLLYPVAEVEYIDLYGVPVLNFTLEDNINYTRINFTAQPFEYVLRGICTPSITAGHSLNVKCTFYSFYNCDAAAGTTTICNQTCCNSSTSQNNTTDPNQLDYGTIGIDVLPYVFFSGISLCIYLIIKQKKQKFP